MEDATANTNSIAAAIDLGSNTFRLLVVSSEGAKTKVLVKKNGTVKLAKGLSSAATLASASVSNALQVLAEFREELNKYNISFARCCGSEALRKAGDTEQFIKAAAKLLGMDIEVVTGHEEAILVGQGVLASLPEQTRKYPLLIVDLGGGSTELIFLQGKNAAPLVSSLPAGAFLFTELADSGSMQPAFDFFAGRLREFVDECSEVPGEITVIACGGTATTLAALDLSLDRYEAERVHGHKLTSEAISRIAASLGAMPASARKLLPGLEEGRGDIIMAGIEIYQEILATIGVDGMIISDSGLLEGIMLSCLGACWQS